jgi:small subunit ribosomal protein S8
MVNDQISDMLTRIRNANLARHKVVQIPATKMNYQIVKVLRLEGFIKQFETVIKDNKKYLFLYLKYTGKKQKPIITALKRISSPGLRLYVTKQQLPVVLGNQGIAILSTSKGILTNSQAKELGIGGEILCYIW